MSGIRRALVLLSLPAMTAVAQSSPAPRPSAGQKAAQVLAGAVAGSLVGIVAWKQFDDPFGPGRRVKGDAGYTPKANIAFAIGSFVGSTAAVQIVGQSDRSRAPIWATAVGTGLGTIPALLGYDDPYLPIGSVIVTPIQGAAGMVAYQKFRRVP